MAISLICSSGNDTRISKTITLTLDSGSTPILAGDNIIFACARCGDEGTGSTSIQGPYNVQSSDGTSYTQIVPPITTSDVAILFDFSVFRMVASGGETFLTSSSTGNAVNGMAGVYAVFRNPIANLSVAAQNSTTGVSSQPDSPSVITPSSNCAVLSMWGVPDDVLAVTVPTTPSSFSLLFAVETSFGQLGAGMCWTIYPSAGSVSPGPWSIFNGQGSHNGWAAATVVLGSTDFLGEIPAFSVREFLPYQQRVRMVEY